MAMNNAVQILSSQQLLAVSIVFVFAQSAFSGRIAYNRQTTLSELRAIDGVVSTGLPVFNNGFFISTTNGPVLVKNNDPNSGKPKLDPTYYFTLPRVIPTGYEGIATTSFNLGSAFPVQPQSRQPSHYNNRILDSQQNHIQQPQQSIVNEQRTLFPPVQNFQQRQNYQPTQNIQQTSNYQQPQSRYFGSVVRNGPNARSYMNIQQTHNPQPYPIAQSSFQVDNVLSPESNRQLSALASQNEIGDAGPQKTRANEVVEQTIAFEESLPEEFRNPFYRNANLASTLAQESLPTQGEQVVYEWDTNKIQKGKIHALLAGAGFI